MVANRLAVLASIAHAEAQPAKSTIRVPSASNESIVESVPSASNESIVESTGLDPETVASVLRELWHSHEIEGILTRGRRALRTSWGSGGCYRAARGHGRTMGGTWSNPAESRVLARHPARPPPFASVVPPHTPTSEGSARACSRHSWRTGHRPHVIAPPRTPRRPSGRTIDVSTPTGPLSHPRWPVQTSAKSANHGPRGPSARAPSPRPSRRRWYGHAVTGAHPLGTLAALQRYNSRPNLARLTDPGPLGSHAAYRPAVVTRENPGIGLLIRTTQVRILPGAPLPCIGSGDPGRNSSG